MKLWVSKGRLQQAVELLNKETYFNIDPNEISLVEINDKPKHTFVVNGDGHELDIRSYELRSLTLEPLRVGPKSVEVFCLAKPNYGGELDLLVVVRPIGHPGLSSDPLCRSPCCAMDFSRLMIENEILGNLNNIYGPLFGSPKVVFMVIRKSLALMVLSTLISAGLAGCIANDSNASNGANNTNYCVLFG